MTDEEKTSTVSGKRDQRKIKNFLLQPLIQIKLGLYSILLAIFFSATTLAVLYLNLLDFATIIFALTDSESEIRELFTEYVSQTKWWILVLVLFFLVTNITVSVTYTHRLVGPTVAFRNQIEKIRKGDFSQTIHLRKGDAFGEVADEINKLTQQLSENNGSISTKDH